MSILAFLNPFQAAYIMTAATPATTSIDVTSIIQYGVLGAVLTLIILGRLVPGHIYDRRSAELVALQDRYDKLEQIVNERVIPALVRSTDTLARVSRGEHPPGEGEYGDSFR